MQFLENEKFLNKHHQYCYENNGSDLMLFCYGSFEDTVTEPVDHVKAAYPTREINSWISQEHEQIDFHFNSDAHVSSVPARDISGLR